MKIRVRRQCIQVTVGIWRGKQVWIEMGGEGPIKDTEQRDTYHILPPLHKLFVDHLASIVFAGLDVNGLFDDSIRPTSESFTCTVLFIS